ncbi:MAG: FKBP-type peptidyl-prolyl cis-trans isomerase [Gemmatimonadales bacterium]
MNLRLLVLFGAGLAAACAKNAAGGEAARFDPSLGVDVGSLTTTGSGLRYRDFVVGDGTEVVRGSQVAVHYRGYLASGGPPFDANTAQDAPLEFTVGEGRVISGWDEGLVGMRVGGRRQLVVPPELGYGKSGLGPIPGGATLIFTIDLVAVR